jgi:uncharacterized phage protein (TIGR02218 family)
MTYDARELSLQSGEPIEMYHFSWGNTQTRYTSAKRSVAYLGESWTAALIKRDSIDFTTEKGRNNLKLSVVRDFEIADLFRAMPPTDVILLTVHRMHVGEVEGAVIWSGRVLNCEFSSSTATLTCEPVSTSLQRVGLRRMYQRQCPHVLYGSQCQVSKASFAVPATLSAVDGLTITSATFGLYADGHFAGGYIDFVIDGNTERRFITDHTATTLMINLTLAGLVASSVIDAYAGCDHTLTTCHSKFGNAENYGGMPFIPVKNPFSGSIY